MEKQYSVYYRGTPIEYTGYLKSVAAARKYLKQRYWGDYSELTFKVVYPQEKIDNKIYSV